MSLPSCPFDPQPVSMCPSEKSETEEAATDHEDDLEDQDDLDEQDEVDEQDKECDDDDEEDDATDAAAPGARALYCTRRLVKGQISFESFMFVLQSTFVELCGLRDRRGEEEEKEEKEEGREWRTQRFEYE